MPKASRTKHVVRVENNETVCKERSRGPPGPGDEREVLVTQASQRRRSWTRNRVVNGSCEQPPACATRWLECSAWDKARAMDN